VAPSLQPRLGILLVMDPAETAKVHALLHEFGAEVFTASTCAKAARHPRRNPIRAIFSARRLPDGSFQDLVHVAGGCAEPMPVVVFLPEIDAAGLTCWKPGLSIWSSSLIAARR